MRRELGRAADLDDLGVDDVFGEELACDPRELRRHRPVVEVRHGADVAVLGRREHEPTAAVAQVEQLRDVVAAGLAHLVVAGDPEVGGAVADVLRDVRRPGEQQPHVRVGRVGVQLPVAAVDDVQSRPLQQVGRRLVQPSLARHRNSHYSL